MQHVVSQELCYRFAAVGVNSSSRIADTVDDFSDAAAGLAVKHVRCLLTLHTSISGFRHQPAHFAKH